MKTFSYSFFAKAVYRFANFPLTILLVFYMYVSLWGFSEKWYYALPFVINLIVLFIMNRYYFRSYKTFPYKIVADNEKIICSDFLFSQKIIEVKMSEITDIKGGIFSGHPSRPIYLIVKDKEIKLGINQHIKDYNKLLTIILQNVNQKLYNDLLENMKEQVKIPERIKKIKKK